MYKVFLLILNTKIPLIQNCLRNRNAVNTMTCESFLHGLYEYFNKSVSEKPLEFSEYQIKSIENRIIIEEHLDRVNDRIVSIFADPRNIQFWIRLNGLPVVRGSKVDFLWTSYKIDLTLERSKNVPEIMKLLKLLNFSNLVDCERYINEMCKMLHDTLDFEFPNDTTLSIPLYKYV